MAYPERHSLRKRGPCCLLHFEICQRPIQGGRSSHRLFRVREGIRGSRRLTTSAAPSPSEWLDEATTTLAVQASLAMFQDRLCDNPEESLRATCDEVRAHFLERVSRDPSMEGRAANPSHIVLAITNAFLCLVADSKQLIYTNS